jgi:ABC-type Fe3+-siderophore transport system permease subunit
MENMTLFIVGIAILSVGTYLMRLGGAKLGNLSLFGTLAGAASDAATVLLFSVALATTFYEGEHFPGMARVLVSFAVFLAWRKAPLIVVIFAAVVTSTAASGGYTLKERLWALIPYSFFYWLT